MATPDNNQAPHTTVNKTSGTGSGIVIGVLVVLVLALAYIIPPTASMDEYLVANTLLNDTSKGPVIAWFQWALTPIHSLMMEFGLAPDWWDKSGSRLST